MNIELLEKIKERILAEPESFDMDDWAPSEECGTTACIAGWAIALGACDGDLYKILSYCAEQDSESYFCTPASKLLDVKDSDSFCLFYKCWPEEIAEEYDLARTALERAVAACKAIDWFVKIHAK